MSLACDVAVIGAGIVGAACACDLASAGLSIAVMEASVIGGGATAAGMGHIVIMDDSSAQLALTKYSQALWAELAPHLPASVDYDPCGTLWIAADEEEMREVHHRHARYIVANIPSEILDERALAEAEPNLRRPLAGALRVPSDAILQAPQAAVYLASQAQQAGTMLHLGAAVVSASRGQLLLSDGTIVSAAHVVHATGASAAELVSHVPIRKRKGHVAITDAYPNLVHHQLVELGYLKSAHSVEGDSVAFNVQPRRSGQLLVGSSRQFDQESTKVDPTILTAMLARAREYLPALDGQAELRVSTGFRAATPDKLPLIGPTNDPTVYLATGHEGLGITTSLATARLITDHILGREPAIPIEPYLPTRFATDPASGAGRST